MAGKGVSRGAAINAGVLLALWLALGVLGWQLALRAVYAGERLDLATLWASMAVELAWLAGLGGLAATAGIRFGRRLGALASASLITVAFGVLVALRIETAAWVRELLGAGAAAASPFLCSGGSPASLAVDQASWVDALFLQPVVLPLAWLGLEWRTLARRMLAVRRRVAWVAAGLALAGGTARCAGEATLDPAQHAAALAGPCASGGQRRTFDVSAIPVSMTLNRFGDHDPGAFMYVLDSRIGEVRAQERAPLPDRVSSGLRTDVIQPLILRANLGECVEINFTNRLTDAPTSLHLHGLAHSVVEGGGHVGTNPDTSAAPGQRVTYRFAIPSDPDAERAYYMHDHGASRERTSHGLFGALVVEPAGSQHLHPETGQPLADNNWEAIIVPPGGVGFREYVLIYHEIGDEDFDGILDADDRKLPFIDDTADVYRPGARAINYRSEPHRNRLLIKADKSLGYNSYTFGDPATPMPRSYLGEPTKTRLMHGGSEVFHVHHLHGGGTRWRANPRAEASDFATGLQKAPIDNVRSVRLDSQNIGPGTSFNLEHECGAGGCQQAAGDFLFHCHIGHHYIGGMWGFWRVYDTLQPDLAVIPGRDAPPAAVDSRGLIGQTIENRQIVARASMTDASSQRALEDWVENQLPPQGTRFSNDDATVWDWVKQETPTGPLYLGEPEDTRAWANFRSTTPGVRPPIRFNPVNGRYAWPLLRPHLGKRPPFAPNGHTGAPWLGEMGSLARADGVCPNDDVLPDPRRKTRRYPVSSQQLPMPITPTQMDPLGLFFVLNENKAAAIADPNLRQPLTIRSNAGDCVRALFTNEVPDIEFNHFWSKGNLHSHFVQFDPQASDGANAGYAFDASVRPHATEGRRLEAAASAGAQTLQVTHTNNLRPGVWIGVGLGEGMCGDRECTEIRKITSMTPTTITIDRPLEVDHRYGESVGVEFAQYLWYSDVDSGTVFWHDHVNFHGWDHGLFAAHVIEPRGSTWHDPTTGAEIRSGAIADIHAPAYASVGHDVYGSFREFVMFLHSNNPVAEGTINMRAEPLNPRRSGSDDYLALSSVKHGDPFTPLPRAYVGDPFVIRMVGLTQQTGSVRFPGSRFLLERWAPDSALRDGIPVGISERFDFVLDGGAGGPLHRAGDYLYYSGFGRHFEAGAWGLLRVHDTLQSNLKPLPDRAPPPSGAGFPQQSFTGRAPLRALDAGQPCPAGAPVRRYDISGIEARIVFDDDSENSGGQVFVMRSDANAREVTEPIALRVAEGECLEISLANRLDAPSAPTVGELLFDPQGSYGPPIGYNLDSTTPSGGTRLYRFYADRELGTTFGMDFTDLERGKDGAYFGVVVEPAGSSWTDPRTGRPATGTVADVSSSSGSFREMVVLLQDQDPRMGQDTMPYPTKASGFSGINFSAAPFESRLDVAKASDVFSSAVHGDPRPVLRAHAGDPVTFRVAQPWGEQLHVFGVSGHQWPAQPHMNGCEHVSSALIGPGVSFDASLVDGAGAGIGAAGDYLFANMRQPFQEAGMWGLLRVLPATDASLPPLPIAGGGAGGSGGGAGAGGGGGSAPAEPTVASAGANLVAREGDTVALDGTGSSGDFDTVSWTQLSGPAVRLDDPGSLTPRFVAVPGTLVFQLELQGPGGYGSDTVTVEVAARPVADAGADRYVGAGTVVTLDGRGSTGATSYAWRQISGSPTVLLAGANTSQASFTFPAGASSLVFELEVTGPGGTATDTVVVSRSQDVLTARAEFRTARKEWDVDGTASIGAGNRVTLYLSDGVTVVGTADVASNGSWEFRRRNATISVAPGATLIVRSTAGGLLSGVPVTVRN